MEIKREVRRAALQKASAIKLQMLGCTTVRCCSHKLWAVAAEDLDEMNIEIMRNTLYKAYLDDFAKYCNKMGGSTSDVMGDLLSFEVRMLTHTKSFTHSPTHPPNHPPTHPPTHPLTHLRTHSTMWT